MTRAALLPAGSDPFLLRYWLQNFATWSDKVDELHISVISGYLAPEVLAYIKEIVAAAGAKMYEVAKRSDHGAMIAMLLKKTRATTIMLCEDDAYVRHPEAVEQSFRFAEAGGIVATPRNSFASTEIVGAAGAALGDEHSYWPCFVFVNRKYLNATDKRFGGVHWKAGDLVLGRRLHFDSVADTFVWASYQLRAMGLEESLTDNGRLLGEPLPESAPWFHVGSLSSGHGHMFLGNIPDWAYQAEIDTYNYIQAEDRALRMSWWTRVWKAADGLTTIPDYHRRYGEELDRFRQDVGVPEFHIELTRQYHERLVTWPVR